MLAHVFAQLLGEILAVRRQQHDPLGLGSLQCLVEVRVVQRQVKRARLAVDHDLGHKLLDRRSGHENGFHLGPEALYFEEALDRAHARQAKVDQREVEAAFRQQLTRLVGAKGERDLVSGHFENFVQALGDIAVVDNDKYSSRFRHPLLPRRTRNTGPLPRPILKPCYFRTAFYYSPNL